MKKTKGYLLSKALLCVLTATTLASTVLPAMSENASIRIVMAAEPSAKTPGNGNPLIDYRFGADPFAMVYNDRVYVYTTADALQYSANGKVKENDYATDDISVVSSSDMVNWTDEGIIPAAGKDGSARWASRAWAPTVCHKKINGKEKFFLYFANNASGIGVLTSDSPTGPWTDPLGHALIAPGTNESKGVEWLFDPAVLVDSDGNGYLYYGGGVPNGKADSPGTARVIKLSSDMTHTVGSPSVINAPGLFEDSGIHKHGNTYYYSYCSNFTTSNKATGQGNINYMTSNSPMGPFTYKGRVLDNMYSAFGVGGNNHHAIFDFKGNSYIVYHSQTLAKAMDQANGKSGYYTQGYRSPHIDVVTYSGSNINKVTPSYKGVSTQGALDPYTKVEAETMAWQYGIQTDAQTGGSGDHYYNRVVTSIGNNDWTAVSGAAFGSSGAKTFTMNAASTNGGTVTLHLDKANGTTIGKLTIPAGNGQVSSYSCSVSNATGTHDLYMVYTANSSNGFKADSWQFSTAGSAPSADPVTPAESVQIEDGWYYIKAVGAQKYLQVSNSTGKNAQNVVIAKGDGNDGQVWKVTNTGNGVITLTSKLGNFNLDVANGAATDSANIQIYTAYGHSAQQFEVISTSSNGVYEIGTVVSSGKMGLDVDGGKTADGTNVCQYTLSNTANQQWQFEKVGGNTLEENVQSTADGSSSSQAAAVADQEHS